MLLIQSTKNAHRKPIAVETPSACHKFIPLALYKSPLDTIISPYSVVSLMDESF